MNIKSKSIVLSLSKNMGRTVLNLQDCTQWSMIDTPFHIVVGSKAQVLKEGKSYYIQFDGDKEKFAADEM
jgi:hypothetical protein